jgi:hypothetical protein
MAPVLVNGVSYFLRPEDTSPVLLVPFTIRPGEEWGHIVTFQRLLERQQGRRVAELRTALRRDIGAKVDARRGTPAEARGLVAADPQNVEPLLAEFRQTFVWQPGEYRVEVLVRASEGADVTNLSRFTLFESDTEELRSYTDDYKYGFGPAVEHSRHKGVFPRLTPMPSSGDAP